MAEADSKKVVWTRPFLLEAIVLIVLILYWAQIVIIPIALAILLTFVLSPLVALLQRRGLRRIYAVLMVVVFVTGMLGGVGWMLVSQVRQLALDLPAHSEEIREKVTTVQATVNAFLNDWLHWTKTIETPAPAPEAAPTVAPAERPIVVVEPAKPTSIERIGHYLGPVLEPLAAAGFVLILVLFMLVHREDLRNRLIGLLGHTQLRSTTSVFIDAGQRISRYLLSQVLVNGAFGAVLGIGLFAIGLPYAFLWAFIAAVLRFIPYLGTWVAAALPLVLSIAIAPGWTQPVLVLVVFLGLDLLTAYAVEPLVFGHSTGVSPVALLVAAAFWTFIWGPIGLLLSTPLTVCLVVLGQHIPRLEFLALLLSDQPALDPPVSFYQRLLARDQEEANELAEEHFRRAGFAAVCDELFVPTLLLARSHRKRGDLSAEDEAFILEATREIMTDIASEAEAASARPAETGSPTANGGPEPIPLPTTLLFGLPAHHETEELIAEMLHHLLRADGVHVEVMSTRTLPQEMAARVAKERPAGVFIGLMPPGGLPQTRFLCRRLREQLRGDQPIVVGYWGNRESFDNVLMRLRPAGASYLTTSLAQTRDKIRALLLEPPPAVAEESSAAAPAGVS